MNEFYVSIIFIGITLIVISLVWIAYDRKKSYDYVTQMDSKKEELVTIINDAEQMIEEMNKFSDYIVTQMELKNEEMCSNLKELEKKVSLINVAAEESAGLKVMNIKSDKVVNGNVIDVRLNSDHSVYNHGYGSEHDSDNLKSENAAISQVSRPIQKSREKVIPLNNKYREVIRLAEAGMSDTEIAKDLRMGKGEVQLILGMNK
ncbi:MAG: hypothetical protein N3I35_09375 [Clostridia bacterium]|nr:hypothetical protein [Clostridia bacterium]